VHVRLPGAGREIAKIPLEHVPSASPPSTLCEREIHACAIRLIAAPQPTCENAAWRAGEIAARRR